MPQTTIQKTKAIRKGSLKVQIGDNFGSLVDIGAIRNPVLTMLVQNQNIEFDNVTALKTFVDGDRVRMGFDLAEINLTNLATLDAGLITLSTVANSLVSGAVQVFADGSWGYNDPVVIENQNGDGGILTINSVTGGTDGLLVANTDYYVGQNENGDTTITVIDSATVTTESQSITVDYDYTPNASKKLVFADNGTKTLKVMRIINTDEFGKDFRVDIENATNFQAPVIDFAGDDEEDVAILPITFEGEIVEIVDEQQTT